MEKELLSPEAKPATLKLKVSNCFSYTCTVGFTNFEITFAGGELGNYIKTTGGISR
jgi:hypothetical protein